MTNLIIKKYIDGQFVEVYKKDIQAVDQIRIRDDKGFDILGEGHIKTFDSQCIIEFKVTRRKPQPKVIFDTNCH